MKNDLIKIIIPVILTAILTFLVTYYGQDIKNFIGLKPNVIWQLDEFKANGYTVSKLTVFNNSSTIGNLNIKIRRQLDGNLKIEGAKTKYTIDNDGDNTFIKFDNFYPSEEIGLSFNDYLSDPEITSNNFKIERSYPFPFELKYGQSIKVNKGIILSISLFLVWIIIMLILDKYGLLKDSKPQV